MNAVLTVARASVTEHFRRKLVLFFAVFAIFGSAGAVYLVLHRGLGSTLADAAVGIGTVASIGLLSFLATIAAVVVSMNNVGRPFSDGEAMLILSRPLARWQYALGRLLGSVAVVVGLCLFSAVLMQAVSFLDRGGPNSLIWGHWAVSAFNLSILVAITTMFSSIFNAPVIAALVSYFLYSMSGAVAALYQLVRTSQVSGAIKGVFTIGWYLTPRTLVSPLVTAQLGQSGAPPSPLLAGSTLGRLSWALVYAAVAVLLTVVLVERKDL